MIVILQTNEMTRRAIQRRLGDREGVFYTDDHRQALDFIRDNEPVVDRTVVILSNHYPDELVNGSMVASGIKGMRPDAWCMLYTTERPDPGPSVDGVIDKIGEATPGSPLRTLIDAGIDDPDTFPDLESLYEAFPWIQRPVR